MKILSDTVELMCSEDYKDRFKAEYYQLLIRRNKLEDIVKDYKFDNDIDILISQLHCMNTYLKILEERAKIEKVVL